MTKQIPLAQITAQDIARFWSYVDKSGECWIWLGCKNHDGYGRFNLGGLIKNAHRCAWIIAHGQIATDLCVCHHCDNRACVNPAHLFLGTHADNMRDMGNKGRTHKSKLTPLQVKTIRELRTTGMTTIEIARQFAVTNSLVSMIVNRRIWRDI